MGTDGGQKGRRHLNKETALEIGKTCNLILEESVMEGIDLASPSEKDDTVEVFEKRFNKAYDKYILVYSPLKKRNNQERKRKRST